MPQPQRVRTDVLRAALRLPGTVPAQLPTDVAGAAPPAGANPPVRALNRPRALAQTFKPQDHAGALDSGPVTYPTMRARLMAGAQRSSTAVNAKSTRPNWRTQSIFGDRGTE